MTALPPGRSRGKPYSRPTRLSWARRADRHSLEAGLAAAGQAGLGGLGEVGLAARLHELGGFALDRVGLASHAEPPQEAEQRDAEERQDPVPRRDAEERPGLGL